MRSVQHVERGGCLAELLDALVAHSQDLSDALHTQHGRPGGSRPGREGLRIRDGFEVYASNWMDTGRLPGGRFSKWFGVTVGFVVFIFVVLEAIESTDDPIEATMSIVFLGIGFSVAAGYFAYLIGRGPEILIENYRQARFESRERQEEFRERMQARRSNDAEPGAPS